MGKVRSAVLAAVMLLLSAAGGAEGLTFFGWSDQHVQTDGSAQHLRDAVYAMNALPGVYYPDAIGGTVEKPAFVFGCGDISEWPSGAARDTYDKVIRYGLRYPSFDIAGNHDLGGLSPSKTITDWLTARHGALRYTFDIEGVHFVALFSEYDESLNNPAQPISAAALEFLKQDLAAVGPERPVIVATHLCYDAITNRDAFVDAMKGANILCVLGGHYHKAKVDTYRGIHFVQLPSPAPNSPSEFTVIRVTEDRITGIPFDYVQRQWVTDARKILDAPIKGPKPPAEIREARTLEIGASAPDFMLPGVDNRYYALKDFAEADVLVVVFTCNHCPTAQAYEERIKQLAADYKDKGVKLVAISPNDPQAVRLDELGYSDLNDSFDEMKIRAQQRQFNFPYLYDGDNQRVSKMYGPVTTPHVFIFDKARKLRYAGRVDNSERGEVKSADARNAIEALLAGKKPPVETTRTFGCSVKWSDKRHLVQEAFEKWAKEPVTLETIDEAGVRKLLRNDTENLRLINVWASWCGPCVAEFPELVATNRMYRGRNFEMVTLSTDDPANRAGVLNFLKKQQASTTNYIFHTADIDAFAEALGSGWRGAIPFSLIVKPGGEVLYKQEGILDMLTARGIIVEYLGRTYK
ncbi:MAG TPA: redoxin family protein [Anaerohalosphaeraceae bacterium]|nr:redoxin family protein [Anaerohalosphaeraceae bacterium]HRT50676.1 redoxin family protein [Anaerohalosphaeraceae bacterium]HRT86658.1 redoxin family protein [Anaerohalosphaeraceae bacterium]